MAATHMADDHVVGIDHAGQLGSWLRLADLAQAAQLLQSIHAARRTDHVDSLHGATSMMTVCDSTNGLTPELLRYVGACGAVNGHAVGTSASAVGKTDVVLPETRRTSDPSPVVWFTAVANQWFTTPTRARDDMPDEARSMK